MTLLMDKMDTASELVHERAKVYGHPAKAFERLSYMTQPLKECQDPELRHAMYMICVKMSRIIETPTDHDSWLDIVGYARIAAMIIDRKQT